MEYQLIIKPDAEIDIAKAMRWYEEQQEDLGWRFIEYLDLKITKIKANPLHYQVRYKSVRMAFLDVFQEAIHFTLEENTIYIHAVIGTARDPRLWRF